MCWELALLTVHHHGTSSDKCGSNKPFYSIITHFWSCNTPTTMLQITSVLHHFWLCGSIMLCMTISQDHYRDVVMSAMASLITGVSTVCSTICSGADQRIYPRVTGLCEGNLPLTAGFPSQMVSKGANVCSWLRHHDIFLWKRHAFHFS